MKKPKANLRLPVSVLTLLDWRIQHIKNVLKLGDHLPNQLFVLRGIVFHLMAAQLLLGTANGVALVVQQAADLADGDDVGALVIAAVTTTLDRGQLRKLLLPIPEHVRFNRTEFGNLTDGEITFTRYRG